MYTLPANLDELDKYKDYTTLVDKLCKSKFKPHTPFLCRYV